MRANARLTIGRYLRAVDDRNSSAHPVWKAGGRYAAANRHNGQDRTALPGEWCLGGRRYSFDDSTHRRTQRHAAVSQPRCHLAVGEVRLIEARLIQI